MSAHPQPSNVIALPRQGLLAMDLIASGGEPMTYLMSRLESVFGVGRRWNVQELHLTLEMSRISSCKDEVDALLKYRSSLGSKATTMFPHSVFKTLERWEELLDRSRIMKEPKGTCKDPHEINRRKVESRMALLKARATCPETGEWLNDSQSIMDCQQFKQLKESL